MVKLLFDASTVKAMLDKHPEIEAELTKNAAAQIAEQFKRKVLENSDALVDRLIGDINRRLDYKYHLPDNVLKVIREAAVDHVKKLNEADAEKHASKAFNEAVDHYSAKLEKRLDSIITTAVEKKVAAVFAAAARMK